MTYKSYLFHIPHSSIHVPHNIFSDIDTLIHNINIQTDLYTDTLFKYFGNTNHKTIIFPYNRFYCDVERYWQDDKEPMSKRGQGVYYEKYNNGDPIGRLDTKKDIKAIYDHHHTKLNEYTAQLKNQHGNCLIIDCHSFNNDIVEDSPDICIGINNDQTTPSKEYVDNIINAFIQAGYTVAVNHPYSGSIYPSSISSQNIKTLMIEVNKKCYMNDDNSMNVKGILKFNETFNSIFA